MPLNSSPLFPLSQEQTSGSYADILSTPTISRDRASLLGSGSSFSASLLDSSFSGATSLFTDASSATSFSSLGPESPQIHAYTQLARQYQQSQDELKKALQEHAQLK
jgi:hypothetical protein